MRHVCPMLVTPAPVRMVARAPSPLSTLTSARVHVAGLELTAMRKITALINHVAMEPGVSLMGGVISAPAERVSTELTATSTSTSVAHPPTPASMDDVKTSTVDTSKYRVFKLLLF